MVGCIAIPFVGVSLTFDSGLLPGWLAFLVLICVFQAAGSGINFNRTICSSRARL